MDEMDLIGMLAIVAVSLLLGGLLGWRGGDARRDVGAMVGASTALGGTALAMWVV